MKTPQLKLFVCVIAILISFNFAYSQERGKQPHNPSVEKPNNPGNRITKLHKIFSEDRISPVQKEISIEEKNLIQRIKLARQSGNKQEAQRLQTQLNKLNGVVAKRGAQIGYIKNAGNRGSRGVNIDLTQIHYDSNVQGIATATERRGDNAGRIWTVAITNFSGTEDFSQTNFYFSDDNGINWTNYANAYNPYEYGAPDAIDAEIIEDNTGTKYLIVAYGAIVISSGKYICNLITLTISGIIDGSVQRLEWPGFDYFNTDVNYYKPRITSDNAFWSGGAYLYIAACQDSTDGTDLYFGEKIAIATDPYNLTPTIDYKPEIYYDYYVTLIPFRGNCDIAWYDDPNNGGGSVMLVESGAYDFSDLYLYKTQDVNYLGVPTYAGFLDPDSIDKSSAFIASNGLYENLMIVNVNEFDPDDNDIQYFSTVDAGISWTDGFVSYTFDNDYNADVVGLRNVPGNYYSAHADFNNFYDRVFYSVARDNEWSPQVSPMNHIDASVEVSPKPGIKLGGDDSCFVIWTEWFDNTNVWGSAGCDGTPTLARAFAMGLYIEGYYDPANYVMTRADSLTVSFREDFSPYALVESKKLTLYFNGYFFLASNAIDVFTNYYVVVNHRNSIETWSASPINFGGGGSYYYDFISSNTQAYGSNEKFLGTDPSLNYYYGIFSGDVNQDGAIDLTDGSLIDNDSYNFVSGYVSTDVNGDDFVDLSDLTIQDNNAFNFVSVVRP